MNVTQGWGRAHRTRSWKEGRLWESGGEDGVKPEQFGLLETVGGRNRHEKRPFIGWLPPSTPAVNVNIPEGKARR